MKKLLIIATILLFAISTQAQLFAGFQVNSIGGGMHFGVEANNVQMTIGMNHPLLDNKNPQLYYMTAGYAFKFSEEEPFSITLHGGLAYTMRKDFTKYDTNCGPIEDINKASMMVNCELGKQWNTGVFFVNVGYAEKTFFGIGVKAFIR